MCCLVLPLTNLTLVLKMSYIFSSTHDLSTSTLIRLYKSFNRSFLDYRRILSQRKISQNKKIIRCVKGGGGCSLFLFLISDILPQLDESSFKRCHRHQFPDHLQHHHLLLVLNQLLGKKKTEEKRLESPLSQEVDKSKGPSALQHTTGIISKWLKTFK